MPWEVYFLCTTKRCAKEISSIKSESELKNKSLKYENSKKKTQLCFDLFCSFDGLVADRKFAES